MRYRYILATVIGLAIGLAIAVLLILPGLLSNGTQTFPTY